MSISKNSFLINDGHDLYLLIKWAIINRAVDIEMKGIKLGLLMGAVLVSSMAFATDPNELMQESAEIAAGNLELFQEVADVDELATYDYDKNVPPSFDVLTKQVGKKDELEIFVPKTNLRYISYFIVDHKDAREYRTKYYHGLGNGVEDTTEDKVSAWKRGFANPATINKMTFYKNGVLVKINVKDSPLTVFSVSDYGDKFDVRYTYGHGYVTKAELITQTNTNIYGSNNGQADYVVNEYKTALKNKGFSYESLFGYFEENPLYENDDTIVAINVNETTLAERILLSYKYDSVVMVVVNKDIYNNYAKIEAELKKKDYDIEFSKLNRILTK